MGITMLRVPMQRPSLRHRKRNPNSEGIRNRGKYIVPQRREEVTVQPPQLVLHPVPTVRPIATLRPMVTVHPILSKLLTLNNYPMPLQAGAVRHSSIRINMRTKQFPFYSIRLPRRPILIQSILGDLQVQIDHLLPPQ